MTTASDRVEAACTGWVIAAVQEKSSYNDLMTALTQAMEDHAAAAVRAAEEEAHKARVAQVKGGANAVNWAIEQGWEACAQIIADETERRNLPGAAAAVRAAIRARGK
jgi:hypothetical protein